MLSHVIVISLLCTLSYHTTLQSTNVNVYDDYRKFLSTKTPYSFIGNFNDTEVKFSGLLFIRVCFSELQRSRPIQMVEPFIEQQ